MYGLAAGASHLAMREVRLVGQAAASASCVEAENASGPCSAATGSIHM